MPLDRTILCLELTEVDTEIFRPLLDSLALRGITLHSLVEEQAAHPDTWLARFAEMDNASRTSDTFAPRTPAEIARRLSDIGPEPAGCIVAGDGVRLLGYTYFHRASGDDARRARQGWTGVISEYRQCGIATGLKLQGILLAQSLGYYRMVTDPCTNNIASTQMSLKVGFRPCNTDAGL